MNTYKFLLFFPIICLTFIQASGSNTQLSPIENFVKKQVNEAIQRYPIIRNLTTFGKDLHGTIFNSYHNATQEQKTEIYAAIQKFTKPVDLIDIVFEPTTESDQLLVQYVKEYPDYVDTTNLHEFVIYYRRHIVETGEANEISKSLEKLQTTMNQSDKTQEQTPTEQTKTDIKLAEFLKANPSLQTFNDIYRAFNQAYDREVSETAYTSYYKLLRQWSIL